MPSRRPLPTIKLTATLATALIVPWGLTATPGPRPTHPAPPNAAPIKLAEQPLPEPAPGETVREISAAEPFSMVALTGADLSGTSARVRARRADGSWGPWYATAHESRTARDAEGAPAVGPPSAPPGPDGTEPVFVGTTTAVQIALTRPAGPAQPARAGKTGTTGKTRKSTGAGRPARPTRRPAAAADKPDLGYLPATASQPLAQHVSAVLITPPQAPLDAWSPPEAVLAPGQPPNIIPRERWGAGAVSRCGRAAESGPVRAAVVHHTAGSNDYSPQESAQIVRSIYAYHTRSLGWCDIGYNALVDKYGQVFEGRAGGLTHPIVGSHAGGFNRYTWGVSMIGTFDDAPPPPVQLETVGRLLGWRLGLDHTDPRGTAQLSSAGGSFTHFRRGTALTVPAIIGHRDLDDTECPGETGYAALAEIRDIASRFTEPPGPDDIIRTMAGGAIHTRWVEMGGMDSALGAPTSPEAAAEGLARYATFEHGAIYWSPETGAQPVTGAIYDAWASLGYERGALGLPTSGELPEPEWIGQNFQHGTLNFDRAGGAITRVVDGLVEVLPPPPPEGPPVQLERFTRVVDPFTGE